MHPGTKFPRVVGSQVVGPRGEAEAVRGSPPSCPVTPVMSGDRAQNSQCSGSSSAKLSEGLGEYTNLQKKVGEGERENGTEKEEGFGGT